MDTTEKVPSTRERQAQQRREKIIQASMQLFWGEMCGRYIYGGSGEVFRGRCCYGISVFFTKIELVIETAEFYWQKVADEISDRTGAD